MKTKTIDGEAKKKGHYDVSKNDDWKPCLKCGGELTQERKAFFVCVNCISFEIRSFGPSLINSYVVKLSHDFDWYRGNFIRCVSDFRS